jgi:hypothetical protein
VADNARGAAFVITGTCDSPTGSATAATTGAVAGGAGIKSANAESCCTTTDSGSNCASDIPLEEGDTGTRPDDSAPATDGDTTELGTDTEAPVFTGISESPRRRPGSPSREDPPPRTTGADSAGTSLTAAPPLPGRSLPTGSAESPSGRSSPTAAGPDPVVEGSLTAGSSAESSAASCTGAPRRALERGPEELSDRDDEDDEDAESVFEPDEPPEPVVSAKATGIAATAEPIPSATASAPTRPTNPLVATDCCSVANTARREYSIPRTRPFDVRRCRPDG